MKKIRLNESDIKRLVKKIINEAFGRETYLINNFYDLLETMGYSEDEFDGELNDISSPDLEDMEFIVNFLEGESSNNHGPDIDRQILNLIEGFKSQIEILEQEMDEDRDDWLEYQENELNSEKIIIPEKFEKLKSSFGDSISPTDLIKLWNKYVAPKSVVGRLTTFIKSEDSLYPEDGDMFHNPEFIVPLEAVLNDINKNL